MSKKKIRKYQYRMSRYGPILLLLMLIGLFTGHLNEDVMTYSEFCLGLIVLFIACGRIEEIDESED